MIRPIIRLPDPLLKRPALDVDPLDPEVVALASDLVETMRAAPACVGLAAPQVGEAVRLFCADVTGHKKAVSCHGLVVLANPIVLASFDPETAREGCMSVPDLTADVTRSTRLLVEGREPGTGRPRLVEADAFEARCLAHELDHLDGLLFLDRVASARRDVFPRRRYK